MKVLYLDIFSGLSGDMFIGALLDLGVEGRCLEQELGKLGLAGFRLDISRQQRAHISGTKFDVHLEHDPQPALAHAHAQEHGHGDPPHPPPHEHHEHDEHHHAHEDEHPHDHGRTFQVIQSLIQDSSLSDWVKQKSIAIFERVAIAEGKIHGKPPAEVHFHEVGAIDSIVDIVGTCVGLELLGRPRVLSGPVVEGTGWVRCAHGRFPLPAPATLEILGARGVAVTQCLEPHELVTPTGAALLAELAENFGPMQGLKPLRIGYGLGSRDHATRPNVLRAVLGEMVSGPTPHDWETDTVTVLETNLDDINPEWLGSFVEKALAQGALDVFHTPVQMKKNRPGVMLTLLCGEAEADEFCALILKETTSFGVRRHTAERRKLKREVATVRTSFGEVAVKVGRLDGRVVQIAPEYESCRRLADQKGVALKTIYEAAARAMGGAQGTSNH